MKRGSTEFFFANRIFCFFFFALVFCGGCSGIASAAYNVNYLDVSPHYAGQIFSIGNTIANVTGIVTPIITGNILGDKSSASVGRWRVVFFISAAFYVFATLVWVIFMRGKPVAALN